MLSILLFQKSCFSLVCYYYNGSDVTFRSAWGEFLASKAEDAKYDAYSNRDKANEFSEQANNIVSALDAIEKRANQSEKLLLRMEVYFIGFVNNLEIIVTNYGSDWNKYTQEQKSTIYVAAQMAKAIKIVLDTALLDKNGELDNSNLTRIEEGEKYLESLGG